MDDRQIDELLTSALGRASGSPEAADLARAECLDASTLAAWAAGALDSAESDRIEQHLATCARCQEMAAIFARTEPVPAAVVPIRRPSPLRWIGPLVGLAAAATLVWAVWLRPTPATAPSPVTTAARADVPAPGTTAGNAPASPPPTAAAAPLASTPTPADAPAKLQRQQAARNETGRGAREQSQVGQRSAVGGVSAEPSKSVSAPVPAAPPPPPVPAPIPVATPPPPPPAAQPTFRTAIPVEPPPTARAMQEQVTVVDAIAQTKVAVVTEFSSAGADVDAAAANRAPAGAGGGGGGRGGRGGGFAGGGAGIAASVQPRPAVPVRWRILASGAVERSTDGGATWNPVAIDPPAHVTAGVAPTPTVCWVVGKGGVVLLSIDGQRFNRVSAPTDADLVSVRAVGAQIATVTAADGRMFATEDGGKSWK